MRRIFKSQKYNKAVEQDAGMLEFISDRFKI